MTDTPTPTPAQIRAARALLDWSMMTLAERALVSISTVRRAESGEFRPGRTRCIASISNTLEACGVQFLTDEGDGPGLRLKSVRARS